MNKSIKTKNPREAAFIALQTAFRGEGWIDPVLEKWRSESSPEERDLHLAREIAYGTIRRSGTLDYIIARFSDKSIRLKLKEKILLKMAAYQSIYMDKIPPYAIVNEMVQLAKKYTYSGFIKYLNAISRKITETDIKLPEGDQAEALAIRYSYPLYFIKMALDDYGLEQSKQLFEAGNTPGVTTARIRGELPPPQGMEYVESTNKRVAQIHDPSLIPQIASSKDYYIQNTTQAILIQQLASHIPPPKRILDLCSSPGGKLIALHDLFPNADFYANDITAEKMAKVQENCTKYGVKAHFSFTPGQQYTDPTPYDLIIVDAPCSNTGVLNKRPEARWRITPESLQQLEKLQMEILKHAFTLLSKGGQLWYMTCSILKRENSRLAHEAIQNTPMQIIFEKEILPNQEGWDGGYACAMIKNTI